MATKRNISLDFWQDDKVQEDFTPEDKYFYLYLLTNPQTNICGCYKVSYSQMVGDLGYSKDTIIRLIKRFDSVHNVLKFNEDTKEILLLNWHKYNWSSSSKVLAGIKKLANKVKCNEFKNYIYKLSSCYENGQEPCEYNCQSKEKPVIQTTEITTNINIKDNNSNNDIVTEIINYLNKVIGASYRPTTTSTKRLITARVKDGYSITDFKSVIDKKYAEWRSTDMEKYLRPETLFGNKFESYLNQKNANATTKNINNKQSNQLNAFLKCAKGGENT